MPKFFIFLLGFFISLTSLADEQIIVQAIKKGDWLAAYSEADRLSAANDPTGWYWKGLILGGEVVINNRPDGLPYNAREGASLLLKAAEAGLPRAYFYVSRYYQLGAFGFPKDMKRAIYWSTQAMHLDLPGALDHYRRLTGTKPDDPLPAAHASNFR